MPRVSDQPSGSKAHELQRRRGVCDLCDTGIGAKIRRVKHAVPITLPDEPVALDPR